MEAQEIPYTDPENRDHWFDTYQWLVKELFDDVNKSMLDIPPAVKSIIDELSDTKNFNIKLEMDYHGIVCDLKTSSGKKCTIYLGIYDANYKYWYYNNKIVIDGKSYLFQTKDDGSLAIIADHLSNQKDSDTDANKKIIIDILKDYKSIKSFK